MTFIQLVNPNPNIPCEPGWCLQYVRQTFGAPAVEPTATAGWEDADFKHEDWDFPENCWVPVWFSLATEPAGHVALLAPDGSVYSTSDYSRVPHHHPDMADLIRYYSLYNPLTFLGWSEDISGVRVVQNSEITVESMAATMAKLDEEDLRNIYQAVWFGVPGAQLIPVESRGGAGEWPYTSLGSMTARINRDIVNPAISSLSGNSANEIADKLVTQLGPEFAERIVSAMGERLNK